MSISSSAPGEILPLIQHRIESGRWWMIPACGPDSFYLASEIEDEFYSTPERARQFDELVIRWPTEDIARLSLFFAHKRWMSVSEFYSLLAGIGTVEGDGSPEADVLLNTDVPESVRQWLRDTFRWGGVPNSN